MYVSALLLKGIARGVEAQGITLAELVDGTGIDPAMIDFSTARFPLDLVDRYVSRAMLLTRDPGLGLTIAMTAPPTAPSYISQLVSACPNLRSALQMIQNLADRLVEGTSWSVVESGDVAQCIYESQVSLGDTSRFSADISLGFAYRLALRFLPLAGERPILVKFRHATPSYSARYQTMFGCPIEFGAPHSAIVFDRGYLDRPSPFSDARLLLELQTAADKALNSQSADRVSERLRALLRYEPNLSEIDADSLARRVGLSTRSMRRKLRAEGTSFLTLVNDARKEFACRSLLLHDADVKTTAEQVGFMERSAFHRAFRRWTGETPRSYQRRMSG